MLLRGMAGGSLELRQIDGGAAQVRGRFPYNQPAEMAPGRLEVFAPRAFAASISKGIYFLSGHDFDRPLASQDAGTLELKDSDEALSFEATISDATSWGRDFLAAHASGLIRGLSPGFRVPAGGERVDRDGDRVRRTVFAAQLFELSAVTRPAYDQAQIEAREWSTGYWPSLNRAELYARSIDRWR